MRPVAVAAPPPLLAPPGAGAGAGSACVAGALAVALVARAVRRLPASLGAAAARRATRTARVALRASKEAGFDVPGIGHQGVNSKRTTPPGGNWMFPSSTYEDEDLMPQKPLDQQAPAMRGPGPSMAAGFSVWIARRKDLPALLASWAEAAKDDKTRAFLAGLAAEEVPQGWAVWALADPDSTPGGAGFYMMPPREPQALVLLEPVDETINNVQHLAVNPQDQGPAIQKTVQAWLQSLQPKKAVIRRPDELALFGLEVLAGAEGSAKVSKGM